MGLLGSTILGTEVDFRGQMGRGSGPFLGQALSHGASHPPVENGPHGGPRAGEDLGHMKGLAQCLVPRGPFNLSWWHWP